MKKLFSLIYLLAFLPLSGCIFNSASKDLVDGYELAWIDTKYNQSIYKEEEEQVPGYIYSVGYDSDYIIAKQHPQKGDFYSEPNYSITNYFIIDINENEKGYKQGVIGPLSEKQFDSKMNDLGIRNKVKFTIEK